MTPFALGIGCRRGCPADDIVTLACQAVSRLPQPADATASRSLTWTRDCTGLFTIEAKRGEVGLQRAADRLGIPLFFLSADALRVALDGVKTRSARAEAAVGVPSVAEAAALVGAGQRGRLIVPRLSDGGATCAIAADWP